MKKKKDWKYYCLAILEKNARFVPDIPYLHLKYFFRMGKWLNMRHPVTFNEKLQWLKQYGRRPIDTTFCDKYAVKELVASIIGEQYVIPLLGVWDKFEQIDFDSLPNQFVLKCTHDSGAVVICKDKSKLDKQKAKAIFEATQKFDYYLISREKAYRNIPRRIIAEEYMEDSKTKELRDYKFFCFNGEPKVLYIASERNLEGVEPKYDFFDMDFNHLSFTNVHPNAAVSPEKPVCFEEMKVLAAKLSKDIPHVRVDFYEVDGRVYFGEMTYSHGCGMTLFIPEEWDYKFGSWLTLPEKNK